MAPKSSSVRATASGNAYRSLIEKASASTLVEETPDENAHEGSRLQVPVLEAGACRAVTEELRRSESLHRTLTANLPDTSMFLFDHDLRILIAEGQGVRQLPWIDENMFRGRKLAELQGELPSEVLAMSVETYQRALAGERGEFEFTSHGLTFTVSAVPIHGDDGLVEAALSVVRSTWSSARCWRCATAVRCWSPWPAWASLRGTAGAGESRTRATRTPAMSCVGAIRSSSRTCTPRTGSSGRSCSSTTAQ
jgi:hypothetical protein